MGARYGIVLHFAVVVCGYIISRFLVIIGIMINIINNKYIII
ncbi:hypothetical protein [Desulfofundulus thermocisternus]|nr:hypothetical protein [Desulfofundulus thermocisternus]